MIFTFQKIDLKSRKAAKQLINTETPLWAPMKSDLNSGRKNAKGNAEKKRTRKCVVKKRYTQFVKNTKIKIKTKSKPKANANANVEKTRNVPGDQDT